MSNRRLSARDYKRPRRAGSPGLRGFGYGLALGLIIAGAVFIHDRRRAGAPSEPSHPVPGARRAHGRAADDAGPPDDPQSSAVDTAAGTDTTAGGTAPGAVGTAGVGGFDFYRMLPRSKIVVPQHAHASRPSAAAQVQRTGTTQAQRAGTYFLQVGSYRDGAVAERIRAKLARQGITATVQRVAVKADVWHRVRVGPIHDPALLTRLQQQLQTDKLGALVIRGDD